MKTQRKVCGFDENDMKAYSCRRGLKPGLLIVGRIPNICFRPYPKEYITALQVSIPNISCERLLLSNRCVTILKNCLLRCLLSRENLNSTFSALYIKMTITFDALNPFQENKVFQTVQTMNNILKSNTKW